MARARSGSTLREGTRRGVVYSSLLRVAKNTGVPVHLATEELRIICNALNEICNGVDLHGEFETRVGSGVEAARGLLAKLGRMSPG